MIKLRCMILFIMILSQASWLICDEEWTNKYNDRKYWKIGGIIDLDVKLAPQKDYYGPGEEVEIYFIANFDKEEMANYDSKVRHSLSLSNMSKYVNLIKPEKLDKMMISYQVLDTQLLKGEMHKSRMYCDENYQVEGKIHIKFFEKHMRNLLELRFVGAGFRYDIGRLLWSDELIFSNMFGVIPYFGSELDLQWKQIRRETYASPEESNN